MSWFDDIIPDGLFDFIPGVGDEDSETTAQDIAIKTAKFITLGPTGFVVSSLIEEAIENIDIQNVGNQFINTVNNFLENNELDSDVSDLVNSVKTEVSDFINSTDINQRFSAQDVADFINTNLIENENLFNQFSQIVDRAATGGIEGRFVDADAANNLIEMALEDINWEGGLRAFQGDDRVLGTNGVDVANGNQGNDTLLGLDGDDYLRGGKNNDRLEGGNGNDILNGNLGDDTCQGGMGDDIVRGGQGNDMLYGDAGRDILIGDVGSDFLYGGTEADDFVLRGDIADENAATADRILDFNAGEGDTIKLAHVEDINEISLGALDLNGDGMGDTAILDSSDRILGVVMDVDVSQLNIDRSIQLVNLADIAIDTIG